MNLLNIFSEEELKLLEQVDINIEDREYTFDEIDRIIEDLDMAISSNLDAYENFTPTALHYEKIQDKLLDLENRGE